METIIAAAIIGFLVGLVGVFLKVPVWLILLLSPVIWFTIKYLLK